MLSRLFLLVALVGGILFSGAEAKAERRVALVIGNSGYVHTAALRNPGADARDMAETLKRLGFDVVLGLDLDQPAFARTIEQYIRMMDGADVALFFYAGHGLQIGEKNYLVSVNAKLENEFLISSETIELDSVVRIMESKVPVNLVFLDACRNNPLTDQLKRSLAATKRSTNLGRGLARIEPQGRDTLIAFAAAPGQEAADGGGRNSPFTTALLKYLPTAGLEVSVMLKEVAAEVRRLTGNEQRPQQLSDMTKTFYFKAEAAAKNDAVMSDAAKAPPQNEAEERRLDVAFWSSVQTTNDCDAVKIYLQRFPNGTFVELARLAERRLCGASRHVTVLEASSAPSAPPPAPASQFSNVPPPSYAQPAPQPAPVAQPANAFAPTNVAAPAKGPAVANLPDPATPVPARPTNTDMVYNIQLELTRLGCASNLTDGNWDSTREAVTRFNKNSKTKLDTKGPSDAMVATLRQQKGRVCELECERGYQARGNTCVAVAKPEPRRAAQPEPPRRAAQAPAPQRRRTTTYERIEEEAIPARRQPQIFITPSIGRHGGGIGLGGIGIGF